MLEPPECSGAQGPARRADGGRLLLVGARRQRHRLARCLEGQGPWSGLPIVGFVDMSGRGRQLVVHPGRSPVPILGRLDRLAEVVDQSGATDVVVALSGGPASRVRPKLETLTTSRGTVRVHWVEEQEVGAATPAQAHTAEPRTPGLPWSIRWQRAAKRVLDIVGAGLGLLALLPLFLVIGVLIVLTDGRPIFYGQDRVGKSGRLFKIWKFRSMRRDAESETGPIWAEDHDRRCTRVGDWLRHTNIDELPQLFNVFKGDMSLVGPRPERPVFVGQFQSELSDYDLRHAMPCGMTGWAQVHGWRGRTSLRKRLQYDLDYIGRWSFWLDLRILVMTIQHVAFGKTSWTGSKPRRAEP